MFGQTTSFQPMRLAISSSESSLQIAISRLVSGIRRASGLMIVALLVTTIAGCSDGQTKGGDVVPGDGTLRDWATGMARCMNDLGWDVIAGFDNSIAPADVVNGIPQEQLGRYQADREKCSHKLGYDKVRVPSEAQARTMYSMERTFRECLIAQGFDIPDLPSEATYLEKLFAGEPFDSASFVPHVRQSEYERVFTTCKSPLWFPPY